MNKHSDTPGTITADAAEWLGRLSGEPGESERKAFADWLRRSPVHVEEFLLISAMQADLQGAFEEHPDEVARLLEEARSNVVELDRAADSRAGRTTSQKRSRWPGIGAAAVVLLGVGLLVAGWFPPMDHMRSLEVFTELGEQRSIVLADGSVMELNTDSRVRVDMDPRQRRIELIQGEAIFEVVKDLGRPFRVHSGTAVVEAIGTRFNVYRQKDRVVVTVVEGRVAVEGAANEGSDSAVEKDSASGPVQLAAGGQVAITASGHVQPPVAANIERSTAWTQRRLIFDDDPLTYVIGEFNRYNRMPLTIVDPDLGKRRISGVFDANDPEAFLALLRSLEPITIEIDPAGARRIDRGSNSPVQPISHDNDNGESASRIP